jgi:hypothetical protein
LLSSESRSRSAVSNWARAACFFCATVRATLLSGDSNRQASAQAAAIRVREFRECFLGPMFITAIFKAPYRINPKPRYSLLENTR